MSNSRVRTEVTAQIVTTLTRVRAQPAMKATTVRLVGTAMTGITQSEVRSGSVVYRYNSIIVQTYMFLLIKTHCKNSVSCMKATTVKLVGIIGHMSGVSLSIIK